MREQVCTYMRPWPRIQGAMLDEHSLQVTYRRDRGEARGPHKKGETWEGRGDCIDCQACVVVCPAGIDIRDGSQLECINCGLCIDACDEIMDRVDRPRGLIVYDTDFAVTERAAHRPAKYRLVRARTLYYAGALIGVSGLVAWGLVHREPLDLHALRDRNPTFVRLHDGSVRNGYTLKIANRTFAAQPIEVTLAGVPGARLSAPGEAAGAAVRTTVPANEVRALRVFVTADPKGSAVTLSAVFMIRAGGATGVASARLNLTQKRLTVEFALAGADPAGVIAAEGGLGMAGDEDRRQFHLPGAQPPQGVQAGQAGQAFVEHQAAGRRRRVTPQQRLAGLVGLDREPSRSSANASAWRTARSSSTM